MCGILLIAILFLVLVLIEWARRGKTDLFFNEYLVKPKFWNDNILKDIFSIGHNIISYPFLKIRWIDEIEGIFSSILSLSFVLNLPPTGTIA